MFSAGENPVADARMGGIVQAYTDFLRTGLDDLEEIK